MNALIRLVRAWLQCLHTDDAQVSPIRRLWRAALLAPPFGLLIMLLRLCVLLRRPVTIDATTVFGARLRCHPPDLIQTYITLFGIWEPDLSRLIDERLAPGDVFVDVGANIGYFSVMSAGRVGAAGAVVAIDAMPPIHAQLQHNLAANALTNVRALNRAVSDRVGTIQIHAGPEHNHGLATTVPGRRRARFGRRFEIEAAPLSDLLSDDEMRRCRLLKIDVEGGEPAVVAGLKGFLDACGPDLEILLELSPAWWPDPASTPESVIAPLRSAGFHTYVMDNSYWPWRYLWPQQVRRPRRVTRLDDRRVKRIDLFLSRLDAPELPVLSRDV